ncbi:MAG: FemAB family protein [Candidatus Woesebacteria bacterium GW2011_GWA1_41_13b]|uniref:FemAB family protein n=1 Tax=Candidatus Woesebacteria bacterium GW2011_GWA1_41_13b TaxID=1618555 RepID=A0A0G0UWQ9_9BACT|nr:MAG: FemAB family protein [Candidatus Woesebacteria bacterium GW2011_GWA1_41_13b]
MHPVQSRQWGEFREKAGNKISWVKDLLIVWSKIPKTPWYFGTLLKSRIPSKEDIKRLRDEANKVGGVGIRIEPDVLRAKGQVLSGLIRGRRFFTPKTFWLDLTKSEEQLLAAMHPKARYNVRLAEKKGVEVVEDPTAFEEFLKLMKKTEVRQGFYAHDEKYFRNMWEVLPFAHLFIAKYKGETLAAWIVFEYDKKIYYPYGASSDEHRELQAPSLMLWKTALWGKERGDKIYDLWGVEEGKGFTDFKVKFGPKTVEFVGTYDLIVNPLLYWVFRLMEWIRWQILGSLRHTRNI